jgi:hypothetical protein
MAKKKRGAGLTKTLTDAAALTAGAAVAAKVANINLPVPAQLKPALPIFLGLFLMKKGGFMGGVGMGMVAVGGTKLLNAVAPQLGIGADEGVSDYVIEGAEDYALAGADPFALNGQEPVSEVNSSYALAGMDSEFNSDMNG